MFGFMEAKTPQQIAEKLAESSLTFQGLMRTIAPQYGLQHKVNVQDLYSFPVTWVSEMIHHGPGLTDHSAQMIKEFRKLMGVLCFLHHHDTEKLGTKSGKLPSFLDSFVSGSLAQEIYWLQLVKSTSVRNIKEEDKLSILLRQSIHLWCRDLKAEDIDRFMPHYSQAVIDWMRRLVRPILAKKYL